MVFFGGIFNHRVLLPAQSIAPDPRLAAAARPLAVDRGLFAQRRD